jgi:hypothetical protein
MITNVSEVNGKRLQRILVVDSTSLTLSGETVACSIMVDFVELGPSSHEE